MQERTNYFYEEINKNKIKLTEAERRLFLSYKCLIIFGKIFIPQDFLKTETPRFHYTIGDELNSDSTKFLGIYVPRDSAKTTIVKCSIIHDFCFSAENLERFSKMFHSDMYEFWKAEALEREKYFYVWIAKSSLDAKSNAEYIRMNLQENRLIADWFSGGATGESDSDSLEGEVWNKEIITTKFSDKLTCGSNLKSVRGWTHSTIQSGVLRITRAFLDDIENEQNTKTENSRDSLKQTLLASILPAIEKNRPRRRAILTGTPVHMQSIVAEDIRKYYELCDENGEYETEASKYIILKSTQPNLPGGVLWESYRPRKELDKILKLYEERGRRSLYFQEYELEVSNSSRVNWSRDVLRFHDATYEHRGGINILTENNVSFPVKTFIGCDPATDINKKDSDFSVEMAGAMDINRRMFVLEYRVNKDIPTIGIRNDNDELIGKAGVVDECIDLYLKYHMENGRVEDVAMNRSVLQGITARKIRLGKLNIIIGGHPPGGMEKHNRIYTLLSPLFATGMIFIRKNMYELIDQIVNFGAGMYHDDVIEALYYLVISMYPPTGYDKISNKDGSNMFVAKKIINKPWYLY